MSTTKETEFARWRRLCGYTQAEAADALKVSVSTVEQYERGHLRGARSSRATSPDHATRVLMRLLAEPGLLKSPKKPVEAWPA